MSDLDIVKVVFPPKYCYNKISSGLTLGMEEYAL